MAGVSDDLTLEKLRAALAAFAAAPKPEVDVIYVSTLGPDGMWVKDGKGLTNQRTIDAVEKAAPSALDGISSHARIMGIPVVDADNDPALRLEVFEHFFGSFRVVNPKPWDFSA